MKLLTSAGEPDGFIESFVHTHNSIRYYGAIYYDVHMRVMREEMFLSRVVSSK